MLSTYNTSNRFSLTPDVCSVNDILFVVVNILPLSATYTSKLFPGATAFSVALVISVVIPGLISVQIIPSLLSNNTALSTPLTVQLPIANQLV